MNKLSAGLILILFALISCEVSGNDNIIEEQQKNKQASSTSSFDNDTLFYSTTRELRSNLIPDSVFLMINLRHLAIMGMDCDYGDHTTCWMITEIPKKIANLRELVSLTLNVNAISTIPEEITQLKKLRFLDLTDNLNITNADVLSGLQNLEKLYLFGCGLKKLPNDIGQLKNLKYLGLTGNPISNDEIARIKKELPYCEVIFSR
jgi:hypothetical protein